MRVVYVSTILRGGPITHLHTLAPSIAALGAEVHVVCLSEEVAQGFRALGVDATVAPVKHKFDVRGAGGLWQLLAAADVVHTHDRRAGLYARPLGRLRGAVTVDTYHGVPDELAGLVGRNGGAHIASPSRARLMQLEGYLKLEALLAHLGVVVVPSQALADFLIEHGLSRRRLRVIPYGIDIRRTEPPAPQNGLVLGTPSYLIERKGIDVLIAACARVQADVRLELFGDGPLRSELESLATRLGVQARFNGNVSDVRRRLEDVDVVVLPTRGDNLPVAILEAMASALPVVSTRVGGIPELVEDGVTGLLVDVGDVEGLATAIEQLAASPELRAAFGRAAARKAEREFAAPLVAERMFSLYSELLDSRLGRPG